MIERKLNEPDNALITSQLFPRSVRRENKMWTYIPSQQTWNKTFLKDLCLGLLSDTLWWSLLWWPRTFLIPGPTQPLPRQQRRTCTCIPAVSLVWHTNANYFNKPTKGCEMGWGWPKDQVLFPPSAAAAAGLWQLLRNQQSHGNGNIWLQQSPPTKSPNKTQVTHRLPYCKTRAGLKMLGKPAFPHL